MDSRGDAGFALEGDYTVTGGCVFADVDGLGLNGWNRRYAIRVGREQITQPGYWSVTVYDASPTSDGGALRERPIIHSQMLASMTRDDDNGLTIWLQAASAEAPREANWLPTPSGPFYLVWRALLTGPEYLVGEWEAPAVRRR